MSSAPELHGDDRLAAEYVLRLLEGEERMEAQGRLQTDRAFAALVERWEGTLAPLLDEIPAETPRKEVWDRISSALDEAPEGATVHALRRKANIWRAYSAGVTALAAALLLVIGLDVARKDPVLPSVAPSTAAEVMVASLGAENGPTALIVTYDPQSRSLIASPAVLQGAAGHSHELWVVPSSGTPRSLGIVTATAPRRLVVPEQLFRTVGPNATLAISVEPEGGSPTGLPTGPVIATGQLTGI